MIANRGLASTKKPIVFTIDDSSLNVFLLLFCDLGDQIRFLFFSWDYQMFESTWGIFRVQYRDDTRSRESIEIKVN